MEQSTKTHNRLPNISDKFYKFLQIYDQEYITRRWRNYHVGLTCGSKQKLTSGHAHSISSVIIFHRQKYIEKQNIKIMPLFTPTTPFDGDVGKNYLYII